MIVDRPTLQLCFKIIHKTIHLCGVLWSGLVWCGVYVCVFWCHCECVHLLVYAVHVSVCLSMWLFPSGVQCDRELQLLI